VLVFLFTFSSFNVIKVYSISQDTPVGGILSGDTVWTLENSPYVLTKDIQIPNGVTLTIRSGAIVKGNNYSIKVWGTLKVSGMNNQMVKFDETNIELGTADKTQPPSLIDIQYAVIDGGSIYYPTGNSINGSLILRDSLIKNINSSIHSYIYLWYPVSDCYIERNIFVNSGGISVGISGPDVFIRNNVFIEQTTPFAVENWAAYSGQTIVQYNSFLSNDRIALRLPSGYSSAAMIADHNYWNTTDISVIESMIFDKNDELGCAGYITYMPILDKPDQNTPNVVMTITASAGSGGSISPSGAVTVNQGDSKTFIITPNIGYHIADVKIDGVSVGAVSTYTFTNITADHTISAEFALLDTTPPIVTILSPTEGTTVSTSTINVFGKVTDNVGVASVLVSGKKAEIAPDGTFSITISLDEGINIIKVVASDTADNKVEKVLNVTYKKKIVITIVLQIGNYDYTINGETRTLDSPPIIKNSRTLLPIRAIIESLGGTVGWDPNEKKVTVTLGSTTVELWISKNTAKVNGVDTLIDSSNSKVVPEIINGRTMLPLRFVAENLGCTVQWDGTTQTITITYQG
jgi:hypothetical protein